MFTSMGRDSVLLILLSPALSSVYYYIFELLGIESSSDAYHGFDDSEYITFMFPIAIGCLAIFCLVLFVYMFARRRVITIINQNLSHTSLSNNECDMLEFNPADLVFPKQSDRHLFWTYMYLNYIFLCLGAVFIFVGGLLWIYFVNGFMGSLS